MMKFFRNNQKWILVSMAFLMVLFIAGYQMLEFIERQVANITGSNNPVQGTIRVGDKTEEIRQQDVLSALNDLHILERFQAMPVRQALAGFLGYQSSSPRERQITWYLWGRLADDYGITVTESERVRYFAEAQVTAEARNQAIDETGLPLSRIDAAFDRLIAVQKLTAMVRGTALLTSEAEVRARVRDVAETASADAVYPDLARFEDLVGPPSDEKLRELYETYKSETPGAGPLEFGYRVPDKVRVEMLVLPAADVVEWVLRAEGIDQFKERLAALDLKIEDLFAYYTHNTDRFTEPVEPPATQPEESAATQPAATQPEPKVLPYGPEARDRALRIMAGEPAHAGGPTRAEAAAARILRDMIAWIRKQPDPGKVAYLNPDNPTDPATVSGQIEQAWGLRPEVVSTRLFGREEAAEVSRNLEGLLDAQPAGAGMSPVTLQSVAFHVRPIAPEGAIIDQVGPPLTVNAPVGTVYESAGRFFIWRVIDARANHEPGGLDEVREQVAADARTQAAYSRAEQALRRVKLLLDEGTPLSDVVAQVNREIDEPADGAAATPATTQPATAPDEAYLHSETIDVARKELWEEPERTRQRQQLMYMLMGQTRDPKQVYDMVMQYVPYEFEFRTPRPPVAPSPMVPEKIFELAEQDAGPGRPVGLVIDSQRGVLAVVQFKEKSKATLDDYTQARGMIREILQRDNLIKFNAAWFDPASLRERMHFEPVEQEEPDEGEGM